MYSKDEPKNAMMSEGTEIIITVATIILCSMCFPYFIASLCVWGCEKTYHNFEKLTIFVFTGYTGNIERRD